MNRNKLFLVLGLVFLLPAIYHVYALFVDVNDSPFWRNLVFVFINAFIAYGVYSRPKYFIYVFVLLLIQQFISHSGDFIDLWNSEHKIDWMSLAVLIYLPVVFTLLLLDRLGKLGKAPSN